MNIEIDDKYVSRLEKGVVLNLEYGSRLFGDSDENSDYDLVKVYDYELVFGDKKTFLPNVHSFKHSSSKDGFKYDIIYVSFEQFYNSLLNGDGTIMSDCYLFSWRPENTFQTCKTYKIIKGYLGTAKRDLTLHGENPKIIKRSARNLFIAEKLLYGDNIILEEVNKFVKDFNIDIVSKGSLLQKEDDLRKYLQNLFDKNLIKNYYIEDTGDDLLNLMIGYNNIKNFKFK